MDEMRRELLKQIGMVLATGSIVTVPSPAEPASTAPTVSGLTRSRTGAAKVIRTPADLAAGKFILPYAASVALRAGSLPAYKYTPSAYEAVGLTKYMGATGERQELGIVTEAQANWMTGGSADNMLAQAEAHGSVPIHALIDGRVINVLKYPLATFDYRAPKSGWAPYFDITKETVAPDSAHYPALSYVPYLATGDQYYLEELQFAATYHLCGAPPNFAQGKGILWPWQQRQFAWALRDIIAAYIATPEGDVSAPLLPKSYWKTIIDNNIAFYMDRYVNGTQKDSPKDDHMALIQEMGFLACDDMRYVAPWQQDYMSMMLGWAVWTGKVPQIRPLYDFQIRQAVKRATGALRSAAIQYDFAAGAGKAWAETLAKNGRKTTADGHYPASVGAVADYLGFLRGALCVAVKNGVPGAAEAFAYADNEAKRFGYISKRWAVAA